MKASRLKMSVVPLLAVVLASQFGCTTGSRSTEGASTTTSRIISQPKLGEEGPIVVKDAAGNRTVFGDYETKQIAPNGKVLWWDQGFGDADRKNVISIVRVGAGDDIPAHAGIQLITYRVYRPDGNISEKYEFFGSGPIRQHVIYRYNEDGKWLKGDIYDGKGKHIGTELTIPEVYMYGENRKKQQ